MESSQHNGSGHFSSRSFRICQPILYFTNLAFVTSSLLFCIEAYRVFSHDVKAAILVSQNNETAAMLVSQTNPVGVQLLSYANAFFCYNKFA